MDKHELAKLMLEYAEKSRELDRIGRLISDAVMDMGETVVVGDVRATYNSGRKSYDWESAALSHKDGAIPPQFFKVSVDWRGFCKSMDVDMSNIPVIGETSPSVTLKVKSSD
jgi:hypothetical protein